MYQQLQPSTLKKTHKNQTKQIKSSTEDQGKKSMRLTPRKKKKGEKKRRDQKKKDKNKDRNINHFKSQDPNISKTKKQTEPICTCTCQEDTKFFYPINPKERQQLPWQGLKMSAKFVGQCHHSFTFVNTHTHTHIHIHTCTHVPFNRHPPVARST